MDSNAMSGPLLPEMMAASSPADATARVHRVLPLKRCFVAVGSDHPHRSIFQCYRGRSWTLMP
jgi:hypothetical protein